MDGKLPDREKNIIGLRIYLKAKRGSRVLATYTSLNVKAFSRNDLATFKFPEEISNEEKVFLVLALMFHDLQLPPVAEHRVSVDTSSYPQ